MRLNVVELFVSGRTVSLGRAYDAPVRLENPFVPVRAPPLGRHDDAARCEDHSWPGKRPRLNSPNGETSTRYVAVV